MLPPRAGNAASLHRPTILDPQGGANSANPDSPLAGTAGTAGSKCLLQTRRKTPRLQYEHVYRRGSELCQAMTAPGTPLHTGQTSPLGSPAWVRLLSCRSRQSVSLQSTKYQSSSLGIPFGHTHTRSSPYSPQAIVSADHSCIRGWSWSAKLANRRGHVPNLNPPSISPPLPV